jgi:hypothetical protein
LTNRTLRVNLFFMSTPARSLAPQGIHEQTLDVSELAEAVTHAAQGLRYGSIEVVVHDARVVQIIRTEKRRFAR